MHYSTPFLLCSQMAGGHPFLRTEKKNLENPLMTSTGNLSSQAKQIRKVNNAILNGGMYWIYKYERELETFMQTQLQ